MTRAGIPKVAICALVAVLATVAAPAAGSRKAGIDVSRFQKTIDWQQVATAGVEFAFVQASRGAGIDCSVVPTECGADLYYATNYAAAKAAGIRVGPYHRAFVGGGDSALTVRSDAEAEADTFIATVGRLEPGDLRPALDMETPFAGVSATNLRRWARVWLARVRAALGVRPIIYTNASSWSALGNPTSFARSSYRLWVASWNRNAPLLPAQNWAGRSWRVWQHTSSGKVDGISGNVDLNKLRGSWSAVSVPGQRSG